MAAGSLTAFNIANVHSRVFSILLAWTSHASAGTVTQDFQFPGGMISCVETYPGSAAPTDNYDITITTAGGVDVLMGTGANRSTSAAQMVQPMGVSAGAPIALPAQTLTLNIANAGNEKTGRIVLNIIPV